MADEPQHHAMSKLAFQVCLSSWRNGTWPSNIVSSNIRSVAPLKSFPSPDNTLYDETNQRIITFEFKPPTETKRGILTSIGQAIAYLNDSNASYIVCPSTVEGFPMGNYLRDTFRSKIYGRIPVGLLAYDAEDPSSVSISVDIDPSTVINEQVLEDAVSDRYWAKHMDMSWDAMFDLIDVCYSVPADHPNRYREVWNRFWDKFTRNGEIANTFANIPTPYSWPNGRMVYLLSRTKSKIRKRAVEAKSLGNNWRQIVVDGKRLLKTRIAKNSTEDNLCTAYQKNFMTFLKHIQAIDDEARLLENGMKLHVAARLYGTASITAMTELKRCILLDGRHLDVILDMHEFANNSEFSSRPEFTFQFIREYESRGMIRRNAGLHVTGANEQFRYETILWRKLGFLERDRSPRPNFNWREISRVLGS